MLLPSNRITGCLYPVYIGRTFLCQWWREENDRDIFLNETVFSAEKAGRCKCDIENLKKSSKCLVKTNNKSGTLSASLACFPRRTKFNITSPAIVYVVSYLESATLVTLPFPSLSNSNFIHTISKVKSRYNWQTRTFTEEQTNELGKSL